MNYARYELKIVKSFGVALDGWPLDSRVCNPGGLGCDDSATLRDALTRGACKWIMLTDEEVVAQQIYNQQCAGEQAYTSGPPLEAVSAGGESNGDDVDMVDNNTV